jgi:hypothetical protein
VLPVRRGLGMARGIQEALQQEITQQESAAIETVGSEGGKTNGY